MNFKKTLGLVLTAALVSTSLVAVKPVKAATPVVATAPTSINFKYFFPERSLLVDGEADTYVVDTDYAGKVQYEFWVKSATDKNAKWQVVSADANGKPGYTAAVDGQNSPYSIPLVSGFTFKQGQYYTAVYVKAVGSNGKISYKHYMDASTGVDTGDAKTGTEQTCDAVKTGYFNALSQDYKQKYNEMLGDFLFDQTSFVKGQKVTFKGFASQKTGAKYKLVVRKFGTDASSQVVLNPGSFQSTVDWTPTDAGTYQVIAWSEPTNAKGAARDGWRIGTVTVNPAATKAAVDSSTITTKAGLLPGQTFVTLKLTGASDPSKCTVTFGNDTLSYSADKGVFYGTVNSADTKALTDGTKYTVVDNSTPVATAAVDPSTLTTKAGLLPGQSFITIKLAGNADGTKYTVKLGNDTLSYSADKGVFYGTVNSTDSKVLSNAASYTVSAN